MFPTAEYVMTGELAHRRSQVAADFATAGGRRGMPPVRSRRRRVRRLSLRHLTGRAGTTGAPTAAAR